jgi:hypothetical protein
MPKNPAVSVRHPSPAFIKGQLWRVGERCIQIGHVGKLLVEHRGVTLDEKRPIGLKRMGSIKELQSFFKMNAAVLMANAGVADRRPRV